MLNLIIKHLSASIMFLTALFSTSVVTTPAHADTVSASKHVCIDPGHQLRGNSQLEPVAPGSSTRKPKVSSGAQGVATRKNEYQLTLEVGLKLRDALQAKGYKITMIRDKNEVNISNKERAEKANDSGCDSYVRIHADGINNSSISGVSVLTASAKNRYLSPAVQKADVYKRQILILHQKSLLKSTLHATTKMQITVQTMILLTLKSKLLSMLSPFDKKFVAMLELLSKIILDILPILMSSRLTE